MSGVDFRKKYAKYKNKYLSIKRQIGGSDYKDNDCVPIIELYEYDLHGYNYDEQHN